MAEKRVFMPSLNISRMQGPTSTANREVPADLSHRPSFYLNDSSSSLSHTNDLSSPTLLPCHSNAVGKPRSMGLADRRLPLMLDTYRTVAEQRTGLSIEGNRTGEEVFVEQTAPRQRKEPPGADLTALRRQLAQAQGEARSLTAKLKTLKMERGHHQMQSSHYLRWIEERRKEELNFFDNREQKVVAQFHALLNELQENKRFSEKVKELEGEILRQKEAFNAEKAALNLKIAETQNRKKTDEELERLRAQVAELTSLLASEKSRFLREKQILEAEKAGVEQVLNETAKKLDELEAIRAEEAFLIHQSRLFVKNVCQPGFTVVKGPSLEPVDKDREAPTGFVLVPLVVLLHGYTLLPDEDRHSVISNYEDRLNELMSDGRGA